MKVNNIKMICIGTYNRVTKVVNRNSVNRFFTKDCKINQNESKQKTTFYFEFKGLEYYDVQILIKLLKYHKKLLATNKNNNFNYKIKKKILRDHSMLDQLTNIIIKGHFHFKIIGTKYYFVKRMQYGYKKNKIGRLYSKNISMQQLSRQLRYFLFNSFYFDIDIRNSAPSFILEYIRKNKLRVAFPYIVFYTTKREDIFEMFSEIKRSKLKQIFIAHLNLNKPFKHLDLPEQLLNLLKNIVSELNILRNVMFDDPELAYLKQSLVKEGIFKTENMTKNAQSYKISFLAFYCQTMESNVLLDFFEYCKEHNVEQPIPFYDGCYVRKSCVPAESRQEFLNSFTNNVLKKKYKYINLEISEISEEYTTINLKDWENFVQKEQMYTSEWQDFKLKNNNKYQIFLDNAEQLCNKISELPLDTRVSNYKKLRKAQVKVWET